MKDEIIRDLKEQTAEVIRDLRSTADVLEAIQHGKAPDIQGRNPGGEWRQIPVARADDWHFLRFTPIPQHQVDTAKLKADWEAAGCPAWVIEFRQPGTRSGSLETGDWGTVPARSCGWRDDYEHRRQPLPTPEQLRIAANEKLRKEWERPPEEGGRFALEFFNHLHAARRGEGWKDSCWQSNGVTPSWDTPWLEYRRKPDPQPVPWTKETCPRDAWLRNKIGGNEYRIIGMNENGVRLCDLLVLFTILLRDYEQLDGTPCGRMAE